MDVFRSNRRCPVEEAVPYFPTAFVPFCTLKSNLVVSIPKDIVDKFKNKDPTWRANDNRAIIQSVLTTVAMSEKN
ncbi:hypothetical protein BBO99_00004724 [Phytophthora kernoviae]|uniref:Uncharacterized protein n=2 Tax=Phytophthora kernoviae TaxID=325452 RepID=A0A3R7KJT7_9STRA|nr:hypothetical protein G195_010894 [Phytophthora kernoviae 00238/432]KAG2508784.1 hypothetical protein JM18_009049 [Phytophthora kernoviae]KAG2529295.1 hypothetical protein JM16_001816 [Phytophthora kernoviae]RLN27074.1 hypothetical protein BBI17_002493 [Phytophthora kernoviae]RLN80144.1 hypothetical protein BBO99_00004724 [Phytophthora kernoviae]